MVYMIGAKFESDKANADNCEENGGWRGIEEILMCKK